MAMIDQQKKRDEMKEKILALKERQMLESHKWTAAIAKATGYSPSDCWAEKKKYQEPRSSGVTPPGGGVINEPSRNEYKSTLGQRPALDINALRRPLTYSR